MYNKDLKIINIKYGKLEAHAQKHTDLFIIMNRTTNNNDK